ncbi:extracellular solute-binding protein [Cellulosilyticum sp. I15G10I2]|uniref:extracellular solute-binding protein n=1 Tax=Cellulosilyticum sp. I15G10I2 TaxID=1892843 RepID=UPI00085C10FC|nr:extracellular solute-binding protein [Cellulosilyticum sp. I15G10I2]
MRKCKLKRGLALAIGLTMGLTTLSGCGRQADTTTSESASSNGGTVQKSAANAQKTKLTLWHIQTNGDAPNYIQDSMDRFVADNPQYEVEVVVMQNDAYKQKIRIAMGTDSMPDIFPHWSGGPMVEYIKAGRVADITQYMNKDNYKDKFLDGGIAQATYEDKIWGMPVENTSVAGIFYNKEIFQRLGLSVPKTISELEKVCDTLLENGIIPFSLANKTKWTGSMYYMYLVERFGGTSVFAAAANRDAGGTFEHEAFKYAGDKIQEWVKKGYFNEGFNGLDEDSGQSRTLLYNDSAAMHLMGSWFLSTAQGENPEFMKKVGFMSFPAVDGGVGHPDSVIGTLGDNFYSIAASCKDVEGAFKAMQYLIDDVAIEKRVADGRLVPVKGLKVDDENLAAVKQAVEKAPTVQLWYDQYLTPEVAELHKDTSQAIFALAMTPEEVNKHMEEAIKKAASNK